MSETLPPARRAWEYLKDAKATVSMSLTFIAMNLVCADNLIIHSDDSFTKQMEKALPSAASTPDVTGNNVLDFGMVTTGLVVTTELARRTSSTPELATTAICGQVASCAVDAVADQTHFIHGAADAGSSGMWTALGAKWLGDRIASAETDKSRRLWKLGAAAFGGVMLFGGFALVGNDDAKLDMLSHSGSLAIGVAAHRFGSWRKQHKYGQLIEFPMPGIESTELAA